MYTHVTPAYSPRFFRPRITYLKYSNSAPHISIINCTKNINLHKVSEKKARTTKPRVPRTHPSGLSNRGSVINELDVVFRSIHLQSEPLSRNGSVTQNKYYNLALYLFPQPDNFLVFEKEKK